MAGASGVEVFPEHEPASPLEPQVLLALQGTHPSDYRKKVMVEARHAHPELARKLRDA